MISLRGGVPMLFGGSEDPTAYGELISIGGLGPEINEQLSAALAEILQTKLSVPPARFYIKFYDIKVRSHVYDWANIFWSGICASNFAFRMLIYACASCMDCCCGQGHSCTQDKLCMHVLHH
jgi:hypothetical protein